MPLSWLVGFQEAIYIWLCSIAAGASEATAVLWMSSPARPGQCAAASPSSQPLSLLLRSSLPRRPLCCDLCLDSCTLLRALHSVSNTLINSSLFDSESCHDQIVTEVAFVSLVAFACFDDLDAGCSDVVELGLLLAGSFDALTLLIWNDHKSITVLGSFSFACGVAVDVSDMSPTPAFVRMLALETSSEVWAQAVIPCRDTCRMSCALFAVHVVGTCVFVHLFGSLTPVLVGDLFWRSSFGNDLEAVQIWGTLCARVASFPSMSRHRLSSVRERELRVELVGSNHFS